VLIGHHNELEEGPCGDVQKRSVAVTSAVQINAAEYQTDPEDTSWLVI
jgi:hypothetical protein